MRGAAIAVAAVLLLSGCAAAGTPVAPSTTAPRPGASASRAAATPADAGLVRFERVARGAIAAHDDPVGMDFVRALEAAGWRRGQLQVTADRTSVGLDVPAVQFSALDDGSCLIGQYGGGGLRVLRADPVDGACLVGETRDLG